MKLYSTKNGILLEHQGKFTLLPEADWDVLINHKDLNEYLLQMHSTLMACDQASSYISSGLLPPMASQELWASGVTYLRSKLERQEESKSAGGGDFYQRVYDAERPELFFKATRHRVVGHGGKVRIRADSDWNVPEPELALVLNREGDIVGYTIGNDMSSRSIEGENPLYLPQAKTYDGCASLGPCVFISKAPFPSDALINLSIRRDGNEIFAGSVAISMIKRSFEELVGFLYRESSFPMGAILMTGTGIVPESPFTLSSGDEINIEIDHIGTLNNRVE